VVAGAGGGQFKLTNPVVAALIRIAHKFLLLAPWISLVFGIPIGLNYRASIVAA
jgi:hypothetical protein